MIATVVGTVVVQTVVLVTVLVTLNNSVHANQLDENVDQLERSVVRRLDAFEERGGERLPEPRPRKTAPPGAGAGTLGRRVD